MYDYPPIDFKSRRRTSEFAVHPNTIRSKIPFRPPQSLPSKTDGDILGKDGGIFRPLSKLPEGLTRAVNGGMISIVAGSYDGVTIDGRNKAVTLRAPAGVVTIGRKRGPGRVSVRQSVRRTRQFAVH